MGFNETRCNNIDRQKQICNFKHTEKHSLPRWKTKINSRCSEVKLKQKQTTQRFLFSLSKTCSFLGLVHFLYCTYCVHTMWNKSFMKMPNMRFSHFMKLFRLIGPKVSRFAAKSFMKVNSVNLGCWLKVICFYNLSFCILFFKTVILSWNFRETRLVFCL
jgi:hypothetical protein